MILEVASSGGTLSTTRKSFTNLFFYSGIWASYITSTNSFFRWRDPDELQASVSNVEIIHAFGFTGTTSNSGNIDIAQLNCEVEMNEADTSTAFSATHTLYVNAITEPFENTITDTSGIVSTQISKKIFSCTTGSQYGEKISTSSDLEKTSISSQSGIYGLLITLGDITAKIQEIKYIHDHHFDSYNSNYYYSP